MNKLWFLVLFIISTGCLGPVQELYPDDELQRPIPVFIISHGWHTGIAVESEYIREQLPKNDRFPEGQYLMFEWGDGRYFPHNNPGFGLLLRAALLPTSSVIHITGLYSDPCQSFSSSQVVQVQVTAEGAQKMGRFIHGQFKKTNDGHLIFSEEGLYRNSVFFEADKLYILPRTSNKWTARALRETGYPVTPFWAFTSGNVIKQATKDGMKLC